MQGFAPGLALRPGSGRRRGHGSCWRRAWAGVGPGTGTGTGARAGAEAGAGSGAEAGVATWAGIAGGTLAWTALVTILSRELDLLLFL